MFINMQEKTDIKNYLKQTSKLCSATKRKRSHFLKKNTW